MATRYWEYLRLQELLALQGGVERDESRLGADEILFICVHQVDELWFKLALHELEKVRDVFAQEIVHEPEVAPAAAGLRRVVKTFELAAAHFELMETMSPRDFLEFRGKLAPASGFQSPQFREIEMLLGLEDAARVSAGEFAPQVDLQGWAAQRLERRRAAGVSVKAALEKWLHRTPIDGSFAGDAGDEARVSEFLDAFVAAHRREVDSALAKARADGLTSPQVAALHETEKAEVEAFLRGGPDLRADPFRRRVRAGALFIETYRELPLLSWPREVLDCVVALEQAFLVFRQRHARMVERMIGRRVGTGGSDGVQYLDATALRYRVFEDLWKVRRILVRRGAAPQLRHPDRYEFRAQA